MDDLRKIIELATSDMLDNPDKNGIYPTGKFYERLEQDFVEYMETHPNPVNVYKLIMSTIENSQNLTITMQIAIAKYLESQLT